MKRAILVYAVFAVAATACGSDPDPVVDVDAAYDCTVEMRDEMYVAGMEKVSDTGTVFALLDSQPSPPAKVVDSDIDNLWTVQITDDAGNPVDIGATSDYADVCKTLDDPTCNTTLFLDPEMPDHGHGSTIKSQVKTTDTAGTYEIKKVNLWMSGYWEITMGAEDHGSVTFKLCIDG